MSRVPAPLRARAQGALAAAALLAAACGTPGRGVPVQLEPAPRPLAARLVAHEVGRLLTADASISHEAERRLVHLDAEGRAALQAHAALIPDERDPRWLHVLDENHALPPLDPPEWLDYLLWKAARPEPFYVMKAQSALLDLARTQGDLMLARLAAGGPGVDAVAVSLAIAGEGRAVPLLIERYRAAPTSRERRAASEALGRILGEGRRPRVEGRPDEVARDADELESWWRRRETGEAAPDADRRGAREPGRGGGGGGNG